MLKYFHYQHKQRYYSMNGVCFVFAIHLRLSWTAMSLIGRGDRKPSTNCCRINFAAVLFVWKVAPLNTSKWCCCYQNGVCCLCQSIVFVLDRDVVIKGIRENFRTRSKSGNMTLGVLVKALMMNEENWLLWCTFTFENVIS